MKPIPTDPVAQHNRFIDAFCADLRAGDKDTPRAKAVVAIARRGDEATARSLVTKLTSASAEYVRRRDAAANWYRERKAEILASAGEAGTAATVKQGAVHEHATGAAGDAQELSHD